MEHNCSASRAEYFESSESPALQASDLGITRMPSFGNWKYQIKLCRHFSQTNYFITKLKISNIIFMDGSIFCKLILRTFSWNYLDFLWNFLGTFWGLSEDFLKISQELLRAFSGLARDILRIFWGLSSNFLRTFFQKIGWFWTLLNHIGLIWPFCLFRLLYLDPSIWTCVIEPGYFVQSV